MNHPTDLDRAANEDIENQIVVHDEYPVSQAPESRIPRLWPGSWKYRESSDGLLHSIHEGPRRVWVIPADVVQDVQKVLLCGRKIADVVALAHRSRARSRRIISRWPIPLAPLPAWVSASSSFRYNSSRAWRRS